MLYKCLIDGSKIKILGRPLLFHISQPKILEIAVKENFSHGFFSFNRRKNQFVTFSSEIQEEKCLIFLKRILRRRNKFAEIEV